MTRNDFVSNSSSCSFIIHLKSKKDVSEFKKIYPQILKDCFGFIPMYYSLPATAYDYAVELTTENDIDKITPDCALLLDAGEDHDEHYRERFDKLLNDLGDFQFKKYKDPDAHLTTGNKLPRFKKRY